MASSATILVELLVISTLVVVDSIVTGDECILLREKPEPNKVDSMKPLVSSSKKCVAKWDGYVKFSWHRQDYWDVIEEGYLPINQESIQHYDKAVTVGPASLISACTELTFIVDEQFPAIRYVFLTATVNGYKYSSQLGTPEIEMNASRFYYKTDTTQELTCLIPEDFDQVHPYINMTLVLRYLELQFKEMFFATPAVVGTFFVGIGGFAIAVLIWGAIFALTLFALLFVLKHVFRAVKYFFHNTKVGQKLASFVPFRNYIQKFCCKAQEVQPKKFLNTQAIGDYGSNIVSKVHVDSKWFKNALKHVPFGKAGDAVESSTKSPSKTPQRSTSRISALTPKILSPKSHKQ